MQPDKKTRADAAHWFIVQRRGPMSLDERQAFDDWRANPTNQAALNHAHEVWGELAGLTADSDKYRVKVPAIRPRLAIAAAVAVITLGVGAGLAPSISQRFKPAVIQTGIGEQRSKELADGSVIALNVATQANYNLNPVERVVHLNTGEATFMVQPDVDRPFLVKAGGYEVRAIGTTFNVRNRGQNLEVAVKEGLVEVRRLSVGSKPVLLRAGQRFQIPAKSGQDADNAQISQVSTGAVDEWRNRILTYEHTTIDQVIRDVNLYYDRPISVASSQLQRQVTIRVAVQDRTETMKRLSILLNTPVMDASLKARQNDAE